MSSNRLINNNLIKQIIKPLYAYYTAGETLINLEQKIVQLNKSQMYPIVDYIKESYKNYDDMIECVNQYKNIGTINNFDSIAIKLSSFDFSYYHINNIVNHLINQNKIILIDAEEIKFQDKINKISNMLIETHNDKSIKIYKTYQMYRKDSLDILNEDLNKYPFLGVKLVRGAYYLTDKDSGILFSNKEETDLSFDKSVKIMFDTIEKNDLLFKQYKVFICTHNENDINTMINKFNKNKDKLKDKIYHASLYGFINNKTNKIIENGIKTYKYLPYGKIEDSVPYLTRRLYENPKIFYNFLQ
jgi:hypothetical protein